MRLAGAFPRQALGELFKAALISRAVVLGLAPGGVAVAVLDVGDVRELGNGDGNFQWI